MALVTENNIPNAKVIVGILGPIVVAAYFFFQPMLNLPMVDQETILSKFNEIVSAAVILAGAIGFVLSYFKKPAPGDGVKKQ